MSALEVRKSKNGLGIFAKQEIGSGAVVFEVKGELISCDEDDNLDERTRSNSFRYDEENYLSPKNEIGDWLNHSCKPNSAVEKKDGKLYIVAREHIKGGEEITIDYSTIIASGDSWEMDCNCGSENCRKRIKGFDSLPKNLKTEYVSSDMVPKYIISLSKR